ncbi:MAG: hypothetical protein ACRDHX_03960 [Chloroflexota bacterium]
MKETTEATNSHWAGGGVSRRSFIRVTAAGALAGAVGLPLLLDACGGTAAAPASSAAAPAGSAAPASSAAPSSAAASASASAAASSAPASAAASASGGAIKWNGVTLPTYAAFQGPKPDFPPSADGVVPAGYLNYPKGLTKTVSGPFGKGDDVSFFTYEINPPPTPVGNNAAWQAINKAMGVNLKFDNVALQDYNTKLNALIAGGSLPDMFSLNVLGVFIANELQFLEAECADLTPFVSGDAIKAYPNLANLPPLTWKNTVFNGKIYALPRVTVAVGGTLLTAQHLFDAAGVKMDFKSIDDFTAAMKAVTKQGTTWGLGGMQANTMNWMLGSFGAPNNWQVDSSGKFTKDWETDQYKAAVAYLRSLWDQHLVDPNTPSFIAQQGAAKFYSGEMATYPTDFFAFGIAWDRVLSNKKFHMSAITEFPASSSAKPVHFQSSGIVQVAVLKKAADDRIKEVLQVANYLAAPFGSDESKLLSYGIENTDYMINADGNPVLNKKGQQDVQYSPWGTIINGPFVLFDRLGSSAEVKADYPLEVAAHKLAIEDPSVGLYSPTDAAKRAILNQKVWDGVNGIIFGRNNISTLSQVVSDWKSGGGDQIRSEYEKGYAANK